MAREEVCARAPNDTATYYDDVLLAIVAGHGGKVSLLI